MVSSNEIELTLMSIFKRCVQCPSEVPSCPNCPHGQICSLIPQSCDACAHNTCIPNPSPGPASSGPNVGAISGGVIGGVVFMAVVMVLLWRFWIKKRRAQQEFEAEFWGEDDIAQQKAGYQFNHITGDGASTRTRASFANSILSRASNIIQIAYIPGVTNRNGSSHNSVAPVPPIPAAFASGGGPRSPLANDNDALFFRPESTWSESSMRSGNRDTQYTRHSITPSLARSSIASEIYHDDASSHPVPAMPAARGVPRMVSVKTNQPPSPASGAGVKVLVPGQSSSPTASSNPRAAGSFGRATKVTVGGKGRFPVRNVDSDSINTHSPAVSSPLAGSKSSHARDDSERHSLLGSPAGTSTPTAPPAQTSDSPFFDASESTSEPAAAAATATSPTSPRANPYAAMSSTVGAKDADGRRQTRAAKKSVGALSAVIEEASRRTSAASMKVEEGPAVVEEEDKKKESPFSDEHATE